MARCDFTPAAKAQVGKVPEPAPGLVRATETDISFTHGPVLCSAVLIPVTWHMFTKKPLEEFPQQLQSKGRKWKDSVHRRWGVLNVAFPCSSVTLGHRGEHRTDPPWVNLWMTSLPLLWGSV